MGVINRLTRPSSESRTEWQTAWATTAGVAGALTLTLLGVNLATKGSPVPPLLVAAAAGLVLMSLYFVFAPVFHLWPYGGGGDGKAERTPGGVHIEDAEYGVQGHLRPVADRLRALTADNNERLEVRASNEAMGGDPAPGARKRLWVRWSLKGVAMGEDEFAEDSLVKLPIDPKLWLSQELAEATELRSQICSASAADAAAMDEYVDWWRARLHNRLQRHLPESAGVFMAIDQSGPHRTYGLGPLDAPVCRMDDYIAQLRTIQGSLA